MTLSEINAEAQSTYAKGLRNNPLLKALIAERKNDLRDAWESTEEHDVSSREALFSEHRALDNLRDYFDATIRSLAGDGT